MEITVTVRRKHLNAAMAATAKAVWGIDDTCLIAQAVKDVFPKKAVRVTNTDVFVGKGNAVQFSLPKAVCRLIQRFDKVAGVAGFDLTKREKAHLAKLRESLPFTFPLTEE